MTNKTAILPVILSGGAGSRLWPMSRQENPKQLLPLAGPLSMIEETLARVADPALFTAPLVVTGEALRFGVADRVLHSGLQAGIVLEPAARNTAPAVAAAALLAAETSPDTVLLVMPSDHVIRDAPAFLALVQKGAAAARDGYLVTFAMTPTRPETGYGYIRPGAALPQADGVFAIEAFIEKPDVERASKFLADGGYYWNSGMFLFQAGRFLAELERHAPAVLAAAKGAVTARTTDLDFIRLDAAAFAAAPNVSIDYAVMEHTDRAATVVGDIGWTDVGNWAELWNIADKDTDGNVLIGDVLSLSSRNCYVRSESRLVAALGVEDLVIVDTDDALLVMPRDRAQDVKAVVDALRQAGRPEPMVHTQVDRPWGYYQTLHAGDRFQVKRLSLKPGAKISLQKHHHRAEHWVVVNGTALVTRDDETILVRENESVYIPLGAVHRLENPGKVSLNVIEVQSGGYLGEDDIVRLVDTYGRG